MAQPHPFRLGLLSVQVFPFLRDDPFVLSCHVFLSDPLDQGVQWVQECQAFLLLQVHPPPQDCQDFLEDQEAPEVLQSLDHLELLEVLEVPEAQHHP